MSESSHPPEPTSSPPAPQNLPRPLRWLLLVFAGFCLVMAAIGVVVPGLPTTVFILIAAWAAARSSPRLHGWLLRHRLFGPIVVNWQNGGFVSRRAKWSATNTKLLCAAIIWWTAHRAWTAWLACTTMACVLAWLWCRPEPRASAGQQSQ